MSRPAQFVVAGIVTFIAIGFIVGYLVANFFSGTINSMTDGKVSSESHATKPVR